MYRSVEFPFKDTKFIYRFYGCLGKIWVNEENLESLYTYLQPFYNDLQYWSSN